MRPIVCTLVVALMAIGFVARGEAQAYDEAAKQLQKDSAVTESAEDPGDASDSANKSVEKAKNLKESMDRVPAGLAEQPGEGTAVGPAKPVPVTPEPPKVGKGKTGERLVPQSRDQQGQATTPEGELKSLGKSGAAATKKTRKARRGSSSAAPDKSQSPPVPAAGGGTDHGAVDAAPDP